MLNSPPFALDPRFNHYWGHPLYVPWLIPCPLVLIFVLCGVEGCRGTVEGPKDISDHEPAPARAENLNGRVTEM